MPFVLAHQGGWDEILMFAVPVALGWWAIRAAEKRSRPRAREAADEGSAHGGSRDPAPTDGPDGRDG